MKATKSKDLRKQSVEELEQLVLAERQALYNARRDLVFRRITDTDSVRQRRHNIARILSILGEKKRGEK